MVGRFGTTLLLAATAGLGLTVLPGTASAAPDTPAPQATSPQEATQLVADADRELEVVAEQVNEARVGLQEQQDAAAVAGEAVAAAQAQLAALDEQMREVARSAFTGNLSRLSALMTSGSADEFLAQVNTLDTIADHTNDILSRVAAASTAAEEAKATAEAAAVVAQQTLDDVTAQQADLESRIVDYQAEYAQLTAAEQEQVDQEHAGPELAVPGPAGPVSGARAVMQDGGAADRAPASTEAAQIAVDTALAQVGDPYVWVALVPTPSTAQV